MKTQAWLMDGDGNLPPPDSGPPTPGPPPGLNGDGANGNIQPTTSTVAPDGTELPLTGTSGVPTSIVASAVLGTILVVTGLILAVRRRWRTAGRD
jgi:hypothetical protein